MEEWENLSVACGHDVARKCGECSTAGAAGVHDSGHSGPYSSEVRMHSHSTDPVEYMGMKINQPRRHEPILYIENAACV